MLIECCFVDNQNDYKHWNAAKCADAISSALTGQSVAAWVKDSVGWWYRYADGTYPKSQWLKLDAWYYFNAKGYALSDEWIYYKNKYYNVSNNCQPVGSMMRNHWQGKYYLRDDGKMAHGETLEIGGKEYVFAEDGKVE